MTIDLYDLTDRLGAAVDRHAAALFVGAGLSMQAGLPSWNALIGPLATEIGADTLTDMPLVAEYYEHNGGASGLPWNTTCLRNSRLSPRRAVRTS